MSSWIRWIVLLGCVAACKGGKKKEAEPAEATACSSDDDCEDGWVCLAKKCANPSSGAIYDDPANAVTPEKVQQQVEQTGQQHEKDIDKALGTE
jgi:hypothetical protein